MECSSPVISPTDIIFTRPDNFDRSIYSFGCLYSCPHEMAIRNCTATKATTRQCGMNLYLFRFETGDLHGIHVIHCLKLSANPNFATVARYISRPVQWFHWCMGEI